MKEKRITCCRLCVHEMYTTPLGAIQGIADCGKDRSFCYRVISMCGQDCQFCDDFERVKIKEAPGINLKSENQSPADESEEENTGLGKRIEVLLSTKEKNDEIRFALIVSLLEEINNKLGHMLIT